MAESRPSLLRVGHPSLPEQEPSPCLSRSGHYQTWRQLHLNYHSHFKRSDHKQNQAVLQEEQLDTEGQDNS